MLLEKGDLVGGKYRVERVIGQGANGQVVAARHVELGNVFAIKVLAPSGDSGTAARFMREGQAIARIQSNHVVRIHDVGQTAGGLAYLVMEHLDGQDLGALVSARGPLPVDEAVGALLEACEGLAEAHAIGVVHRDLKPASLFLARRSVTGDASVKVIDFGVDKPVVAPRGRPAVIDNEGFTAPEQLNGEATPRSDVWSLGATLYKLLTGKHPFAGKNAAELSIAAFSGDVRPLEYFRQDVPSAIESVIMRCLRKIPEERYADARALGDALLYAYSDEQPPDSNSEATVARAAPAPGGVADYLARESQPRAAARPAAGSSPDFPQPRPARSGPASPPVYQEPPQRGEARPARSGPVSPPVYQEPPQRGEPRTVAMQAAGNAASYLAAEQQRPQHQLPPAFEDDEPGGGATMIRAPMSSSRLPVGAQSSGRLNAPVSGPQLPVAPASNPHFNAPVSGPHLPAAPPSDPRLSAHLLNAPVSGPHLPAAPPPGRRPERSPDEMTIVAPIETVSGRFPLAPPSSSQSMMPASPSQPMMPVSPSQQMMPVTGQPQAARAPTKFAVAESNLDPKSKMMLMISAAAILFTALCLIGALMWKSSAQKDREAREAAAHKAPTPTTMVVVSATPTPPVAPVVIAPPGDVAPIVPSVDTGPDTSATADPTPAPAATPPPTARVSNNNAAPGPRPTAAPAGPRPMPQPGGGKKGPKKAVYDTP